jgi:hypothetical protein
VAYTMREADEAEQRAADALAYSRRAALNSEARQKDAIGLRRGSDEARKRLPGRA